MEAEESEDEEIESDAEAEGMIPIPPKDSGANILSSVTVTMTNNCLRKDAYVITAFTLVSFSLHATHKLRLNHPSCIPFFVYGSNPDECSTPCCAVYAF